MKGEEGLGWQEVCIWHDWVCVMEMGTVLIGVVQAQTDIQTCSLEFSRRVEDG